MADRKVRKKSSRSTVRRTIAKKPATRRRVSSKTSRVKVNVPKKKTTKPLSKRFNRWFNS